MFRVLGRCVSLLTELRGAKGSKVPLPLLYAKAAKSARACVPKGKPPQLWHSLPTIRCAVLIGYGTFQLSWKYQLLSSIYGTSLKEVVRISLSHLWTYHPLLATAPAQPMETEGFTMNSTLASPHVSLYW